jgi:predicted membrane protein
MNKIDYIFQKATDWIFRKKSILYLLIMTLFREFIAINISDTLLKWEMDSNLQDWYFHYPIMFLNFVFSGGNWTVIWILVALIIIFIIYELIKAYLENKKEIAIVIANSENKKDKQTIINKDKVKKQVNIKKIKNLEKLEL